jgi:hypothetical protein
MTEEKVIEALNVFKSTFFERRIWPDRNKVVVKIWPENIEDKQILASSLKAAGFERGVNNMVLFRQL